MASIILDYEYDIFISYRQKDNKYDGWVTEFVDNLKRELEATFKEEVSVYFDINPHDGLLETHDVNASLKEKLKCLVFIPIISQTYCDSKSFAWQHEFVEFNKLAKEDQFGRDIRLTGGNVAGRILPIKIHELVPEDKIFLENELGGVLRSIEFIYKSAGVNRPLRANEDHPQDNLNKTYYRDQINKVANAVKEIITAIKKYNQQDGVVPRKEIKTKPEKPKSLKLIIIIASIIALTLFVFGSLLIPKLFKSFGPVKKSIAVLPFKLLSDEPDKQYLADGVMDAILLHLQKFNDLRVLSRTSVEQYRGTKKTTHAIGQELGVAYLLEGSFQKAGDNVRLIVQLIKTSKEESHAWANEYDRNWKEIFSVQSEVAQTIAGELHTIITPAEKKLIKIVPTSNLTAYDLFLKANGYKEDYQKTRNVDSYQKAITFYKAAIEIDSTFAKVYTGWALAYSERYGSENYLKEAYIDTCLVLANKALTFDNKLDEAYYIRGGYYTENGHIKEAFDNYNEALNINPNYADAYIAIGYVFQLSNDYVGYIENFHKALNLIEGNERSKLLRNLAEAYEDVGFIDKAKYYDQEASKLDSVQSQISWANENNEESRKLNNKFAEIDSTNIDYPWYIPGKSNKWNNYRINKIIEYHKERGESFDWLSHRMGWALCQVGKKKEAEYYFNQEIKYCEESIKLRRSYATWGHAYYDLAGTYASLGDKVKAYKYLDEWNISNCQPLFMINIFKSDPLFTSILNEDRFQKIIQNVEAKYRAEHERVRKRLGDHGML